MPVGCNCGPNTPLAWAPGCHCVRRGTAVIASQLPLPRLWSAAVQDCKWRCIKWASFTWASFIILTYNSRSVGRSVGRSAARPAGRPTVRPSVRPSVSQSVSQFVGV